MKSDICKVFTDYPEYSTAHLLESLGNCENLNKGSLKKGFSASMTDFFSLFPTFTSLYSISTSSDLAAAIDEINNTGFDVKDFADFNQFLVDTIESFGKFLDLQYQNKFNFIENFQIGVMLY